MSHDDDRDGDDVDEGGSSAPSFDPSDWHKQHLVNEAMAPRGLPVSNSPELTRIVNLPRRPTITKDSPTAEALVRLDMQKYSLGPRQCRCRDLDPDRQCIRELNWIQAWMLYEIELVGGLLGQVAVGAGKCCHPSVEIFDYQQGRRRSVAESGALRVASFDRNLHVRDATAFPSGKKACVDVRLRDGTSLIVSTDHPILTARGWVPAVDLQLNDMVAVAASLPEPERMTQASDEEIAFVAYMLSDGGCSQSTMSFTNATPTVIDDWKRCATTLGYGIANSQSRSRALQFRLLIGTQRATSGCGHFVKVHDRVRERWGLHGLAKHKRAHADIWGLPRAQVALFLNRFWACDGHVSARALEITLASEKLIDDLRFLLLRLGVRSRKHYKVASYTKRGVRRTFDAWRLMLNGADAARFLDEVGDVLGKEDACKTLRARLAHTQRNTNFDVVPVGPDEVQEICAELDLPKYRTGSGYNTPLRSKVRKELHASPGQCVSRDKFVRFCAEWHYTGKYAHLATTDVAWERVEAVVEAGAHDVYDLNVPETHNFVANGVVIHNTVCNILAPLALRGCRLALLLIPPTLVKQLIDEYQMVAEHFRVPGIVVHLTGRKTWVCEPKKRPAQFGGGDEPVLHVLPYSRLSGIENSEWINNLQPDLIIADEVDALKDMESARTMRVMRYFEEHEATTRFCGWTGSLTDNSIREMAHLSALALRGGSPLPLKREVIDEWSQCLDAVPQPTPIGALKRLLELDEEDDDMRRAFRRRMSETPGFVMVEGRQTITAADGTAVQVEIRERKAPAIPAIIDEALAKVRQSCRPDTLVLRGDEDYQVQDEILSDPLEQAKCAREVACGFFYRWVFPKVREEVGGLVEDPHGVAQSHDLISEWYAARKAWNSELRQKMLRGEANLDSPKLCENAARRAWDDLPKDPDLPEWEAENWPAWRDIEHKVLPKPEAQRLHSFLVDDAAKWAVDHRGLGQSGIIWYANVEFAAWVAERARELYGVEVPVHGGGPGAEEAILKERGDRTILASIKSHGRGRNKLQYRFNVQLLAQMLASSRMMEQLLGRLHRRGQEAASVITELYAHTDEVRKAFEQALMRAEYVEDVMGAGQKLIEGWRGFDRTTPWRR